MAEFDTILRTMRGLQDKLVAFQAVIKESEKDPEVLLKDFFLPTESDRMYVLTKLMMDGGEDVFNNFISEYFNKILKVLDVKIPMEEVSLVPSYYNDEYVLIGIVDETPKLVINTFEKTIAFIKDENIDILYSEESACIELIADLEKQLENVSSESDKLVFNKKKHAAYINETTNMIISQLGIEKQNLSRIKENIEDCIYYNNSLQTILDRYASRLVNYYQYVIVGMEDTEQYK